MSHLTTAPAPRKAPSRKAPRSLDRGDGSVFALGPADLDNAEAVRELGARLDEVLAATRPETVLEMPTPERAEANERACEALKRFRHRGVTLLDDSGDHAALKRRTLPRLVIHRGDAYLFDDQGGVQIIPYGAVLLLDAAG